MLADDFRAPIEDVQGDSQDTTATAIQLDGMWRSKLRWYEHEQSLPPIEATLLPSFQRDWLASIKYHVKRAELHIS